MKKLLTILSAFGLVASASINVVACGDTKPPEIKEKTDWVKEDAIKNLGELHYENNGGEIKIISETFKFNAYTKPNNPEDIEWKKEISLKEEEFKQIDGKMYGESTIDNQYNYELLSYISLSKYAYADNAIKDYNDTIIYTKKPFLNFYEDWFTAGVPYHKYYRFNHQVYDKNGENPITVYFTTIMFDFIFGYINENIDKIMQEIIIDFKELALKNNKENVDFYKDGDIYILKGMKFDEYLEIENESSNVYIILIDWLYSKCLILEKQINAFNIKESKMDYLKETSYQVKSGYDRNYNKLELGFLKKSPLYEVSFDTVEGYQEEYRFPLIINLEER